MKVIQAFCGWMTVLSSKVKKAFRWMTVLSGGLPILTFAFLVISLCRCIDNTGDHRPSWLMPVISVLAISTAAIHASYIFSGRKNTNPQAIAAIVVAWAIVPPAYFAFEWAWVFQAKTHGEVFETFKYSQELASRVWAAFLIILGLLGQRQLEKSLEKPTGPVVAVDPK